MEPAQFHPLAGQLPQQLLAHPVPVSQVFPGFVQHGGGLLGAGLPGLVVHAFQMQGVHEHTHPNHIELVQIALEDGGEIQPFAQGVGGVLRLLQHPAVKLEPGQLPVDIARAGRGAWGGGRALFSHGG